MLFRDVKFNAIRSSTAELTDMHFAYEDVCSNALTAERLKRELFPNPSRRVLISLDRRMRETGSLQRRHEDNSNTQVGRGGAGTC